MNRPIFTAILIAFSSAALAAQQSGQQNPYQGTSNPPADDAIVTDQAAPAKPHAAHPLPAQQAAPAEQPQRTDQAQTDQNLQDQQQANQSAPDQTQVAPAQPPTESAQSQPASQDSNGSVPADGTVAGVVAVAPPVSPAQPQPVLASRTESDPDGDIVHPAPLRPGEIGEGTTIRVKLLDRLSTALTERGEAFHSRVATDVLQGGQVVIPAGTEIDGTVIEVSSGHAGGSGSLRLRPDEVVLADGTRYRLFAQVTGTPGSNTHVVGEGTIKPDSRWRRNSIEYGGAVGTGVVAGAVMAGPVGALTGGIIGAGAITAHLLIGHPQATLEPGTTLMLELTGPLQMTPANPTGN